MTPVRMNAANRRGASLTEVLMALMIMGIGLSSIFTLFPLSIVRSIRATQLTNAQLMRGNVEQLFRVTPEYFSAHHLFGGPPAGFRWSDGTNYPFGGEVYPTNPPANKVKLTDFSRFRSQLSVPFERYRVTETYDTGTMTWVSSGSGDKGGSEPQWRSDITTVEDNQLRWSPVVYSCWAVDPLGWYSANADGTFNADGTSPDGRDHFGIWCGDRSGATGDSITTASSVGSWTVPLRRINSGLTSLNSAVQLAAHPDAWSQIDTFTPLSATTTATTTILDLPPATKITSLSGSTMRATVRNSAGTQSVSSAFAYNSTTFQLTLNTVASAAILSDLGTVTIESFDSRYTWFATVNNINSSAPVIKVATVFKRKFTPGEEHVYRSVHGPPASGDHSSSSDPHIAGAWGAAGGLSNDQILVVWDSATEPRPLIQEGSHVFDPTPTAGGGNFGVQWYKIVAVTAELSVPSSTARYMVVTVDQPTINRTAVGSVGRAMFIRGLIDVYQLF